ncbi:hypothetical protein HPB50_019192 [Hyalomma asiaticum]|uniref:Uncharacterized protein n=1 Tax=Hyalomma asiaticum TaxID=266040 RepID=A0ACB7S839_HYAAI|nr:hypothetical protein HPB50_019192 [Hyalomma asiaticum]
MKSASLPLQPLTITPSGDDVQASSANPGRKCFRPTIPHQGGDLEYVRFRQIVKYVRPIWVDILDGASWEYAIVAVDAIYVLIFFYLMLAPR